MRVCVVPVKTSLRDGGIFPSSKGTCSNIIGKGYRCTCDDGAYGDHCQHRNASGGGGGGGGGGGNAAAVSSPPPPSPVVDSAGVFGAAPDWVAYVVVLAVAVAIHNAVMFL